MKKKSVKKLLFTAGVVLMGLGGAKMAFKVVDEKEAMTNIEMANEVLDEIRERLESDSLNPEERHELILTQQAIMREIHECAQRLNARQRAAMNIPPLDAAQGKKSIPATTDDDVVIIQEIQNRDIQPLIIDKRKQR